MQVGVQVTAGNNENQHQDNDLSLPQQTEHLSLPSPLLFKTSSQFLKESQYHLSATSIKEQAVMQEISGLNHTRFISYRRAGRKPTNKPQCSQNPPLAEHHTLSQPRLQKQPHSTSGMQGFTASQSWQRKWLLREAIYTGHSQNTPSGMLKKALSGDN